MVPPGFEPGKFLTTKRRKQIRRACTQDNTFCSQ